MTDHAIDGSLMDACEPSGDLDVVELEAVASWLDSFENDPGRRWIVDRGNVLWGHYAAYDPQNRAFLAFQAKWDTQSLVPVTAAAGSPPGVPSEWQHLDTHRKWLLAVVLARFGTTQLVNTLHESWAPSRLVKSVPQPVIFQVLEAWIDSEFPPPQDLQGNYVPAPGALTGMLAAATSVGKGHNHRDAWEDADFRYEWDYQHGTVEVYSLPGGTWVREATPAGVTTKTTTKQRRYWGKS